MVGTDAPFRDRQGKLALVRTALFAVDEDAIAVDANKNVLRFQSRHRGRQQDALVGLVDPHGHHLPGAIICGLTLRSVSKLLEMLLVRDARE